MPSCSAPRFSDERAQRGDRGERAPQGAGLPRACLRQKEPITLKGGLSNSQLQVIEMIGLANRSAL
jgi:hypothetical protein